MLNFSKRWQLTLVYFLPVFLILSIFSSIVFKIHADQIEMFYDSFEEIAFNFENNSTESDIITENDWETLSDADIDKKLIEAGEKPIGDPNDPFYHYSAEELEKLYESEFKNEYLGTVSQEGIIFLDPDTPNEDSSESVIELPYISIQQIDQLETDLRLSSLRTIFTILLASIIIFAFLAYYFAGKTLKPIEEALEKQKRFVSDASHELRTPLALMKSEAEVLMRVKDSSIEEYEHFSKDVVQDVNYLNTLTTNLLQLAKIDQNKKIYRREEINFNFILNKQLKYFKNRIGAKNIKIVNNPSQENITFQANKEAVAQVLTIILDNAVKFSETNGEINIFATKTKSKVLIKVQDSGVGIPKKDLPYIFDRFYRSSEDRNAKGHGLGLPIAKEIMQLLGGKISAKSTQGLGTTVTLFFSKKS